jgi:hypothetical protein
MDVESDSVPGIGTGLQEGGDIEALVPQVGAVDKLAVANDSQQLRDSVAQRDDRRILSRAGTGADP